MNRYYYDQTGLILGKTFYRRMCMMEGISNSVGYIDSEQEVDMNLYKVDLSTLTLVPINQ